jgi:hypothetical protein
MLIIMIAQVAQTSRAMAREAEADVVWATLFLRRFGSDFWGEHVGPHPYHVPPRDHSASTPPPAPDLYSPLALAVQEVEALRGNEWLDMPAVAVFETFVLSVKVSPSSGGGDDQEEEESEVATRRALLAFVRGERGGDSSGQQGGGWKRAYKRFGP